MFDALDKCPEQEQGDILAFITNIGTLQIGCHVKVFVSSLYEMGIAKSLEDKQIPAIEIRAENVVSDTEVFVRSQVRKLQSRQHGKTL